MDIRFMDEKAEGLHFHRKGDVLWLSSPLLDAQEWLLHGFSTRFGGVSEGCLASMNLSFARERDNRDNVIENFFRISEAIGFPVGSIVTSDQTHTTNVVRVGKKDCGRGIFRDTGWSGVDALITDEPETTLAIFTADCVPILIADPVRMAVAASHSGWRGTAGRMAEVTVRAMEREFDSKPEDLLAAIGPCICRDCYEVGEEVAEQFPAKYVRVRGGGKYDLDLMEANRQILIESGLAPGAISMPGLCTCCNPDLLFSHRASKGQRGNFGTFITIRRP